MFNKFFSRKRKSQARKHSYQPTLERLEHRRLFAADTGASPTKPGVGAVVTPVVAAEVSNDAGPAPTLFAKGRVSEQHAPDTLSGETAMRVLERVYGRDSDGYIRYPAEFDPRIPGISGTPKVIRNSLGEKVTVIDVNTVVITIDPAALEQAAGPVQGPGPAPQAPAGQIPYTDEHRLRLNRLRTDIEGLLIQSIGRSRTIEVIGSNGRPVTVTTEAGPGTPADAEDLHASGVAYEQRLNALIAQAGNGNINPDELQALRDDVTRSQMAADKRKDPRDYQDPEEETRRLDAEVERELDIVLNRRPQGEPKREVRGWSQEHATMSEIVGVVRRGAENTSNDAFATAEREIPQVPPLDAVYTNDDPIDGATAETLADYNRATRAADAAQNRYNSLVAQFEKAFNQLRVKQNAVIEQFYRTYYASNFWNPNWSDELRRLQEQMAEEERQLRASWGEPIVAANQAASDASAAAGRLWSRARDEESAVISRHEKARTERVAAVSRRISELLSSRGDQAPASFLVPESATTESENVGGNLLVVRSTHGSAVSEQIVNSEQLAALQQAEIEKRDAAYFELERLRWSGRMTDKEGRQTPEYEAVARRYAESAARLSELTSPTLLDRDGELARAQAAEENRLNSAMEALRSQGYEVTRTSTGYEARMTSSVTDTAPRHLPTITLPGRVPMSALDAAVAAIASPITLCPNHVDAALADVGTSVANQDVMSDAQPNSPLNANQTWLEELYRDLNRQNAILGDYRRAIKEGRRRVADLNEGMNAQFLADHSSAGIGLSAEELYHRRLPNRPYPNYYVSGQPRHLDAMVASGDAEVPSEYMYRQHQVARDAYTANDALWPQAIREQEQRIQQVRDEILRLGGHVPSVNGNDTPPSDGPGSNDRPHRPTLTPTNRPVEPGAPPAQDGTTSTPVSQDDVARRVLDGMRAELEQRTQEYAARFAEWRAQRVPVEIAANRVDAREGTVSAQELQAARLELAYQLRLARSRGFDPNWAAVAGRELSQLQDEVRRQERMLAERDALPPTTATPGTTTPGEVRRPTTPGPSTGDDHGTHLPGHSSRPVRRPTRK